MPSSEAVQPALAALVASELEAVAGGGRGGRAERPAAESERHLRAVCRLSHDVGMPAERVVVLLKAEWARATADQSSVARHQLQERLTGLVSAWIAAFYRGD